MEAVKIDRVEPPPAVKDCRETNVRGVPFSSYT